jgi:hypothetical protein
MLAPAFGSFAIGVLSLVSLAPSNALAQEISQPPNQAAVEAGQPPEQTASARVTLAELHQSPSEFSGRSVIVERASVNRIPRRDLGILCLDVDTVPRDSFAGVYLTDRKVNFIVSDELARDLQSKLSSAYERNARIACVVRRVQIQRIGYWIASVTRIEAVRPDDGQVEWSTTGPEANLEAIVPLAVHEAAGLESRPAASAPVDVAPARTVPAAPADDGEVPALSGEREDLNQPRW